MTPALANQAPTLDPLDNVTVFAGEQVSVRVVPRGRRGLVRNDGRPVHSPAGDQRDRRGRCARPARDARGIRGDSATARRGGGGRA